MPIKDYIAQNPNSLFGNLVVEFEPKFGADHIKESYQQLQRHKAAIWAYMLKGDRNMKD